MSEPKNQEFLIPVSQAMVDEMAARFSVQKTVTTGQTVIDSGVVAREVEVSENEMILEILKIGNEVEALRVRKIGEKHVRFWKTTPRTTD